MTITSIYNMAHRERMDCELRVIDANYDHVAQGIIFSVLGSTTRGTMT